MKTIVTVAGATLTLLGLCLIFFTDWSLTGLTVWAVGFLTMLFAPSDRNLLKHPVSIKPMPQVSTRLEIPIEWDQAFEQPVVQIPDSFFSALSESQRR